MAASIFGMFGVYQESQPYTQYSASAFTANWTGYGLFSNLAGVNGLVNIDIDFENTGTTIPIDFNEVDARAHFINNSIATYKNKTDGRHVHHSNPDDKGFIAASFTGGFLENAYTCRTSPRMQFSASTGSGRPFKAIIRYSRPDLVKHIESYGSFGAAGSGNYFDGSVEFGDTVYKIPYFYNLQTITIISSTRLGLGLHIRRIVGQFPPQVHSISILGTSDITTIEHAFPNKLKRLCLSIPTTAIANDTARLLSPIGDSLEELSFTTPNYSVPNSGTPLTGTLNLTNFPNLRRLQIRALSLTDITLSPSHTSFHTLFLTSTYSLTNLKKEELINKYQASSDKIVLSIADLRVTSNQSFSNVGHPNFVGFVCYYNRLTGTVTFSDPFTPATFALGNSAALQDENSNHYINNLTSVDLTGMRPNATTIGISTLDVSNCRTEFYLPPTESVVIANFSCGGNKYDTTIQPNLLSLIENSFLNIAGGSIRLYFSITTFQFHPTYYDKWGQSSVNGIGANPDFTAYGKLVEIYLRHCKITGNISLPNSTIFQILDLGNNPGLLGIAGTFNFSTTLANIIFQNSPSLVVDMTRFPGASRILCEHIGNTLIDLTNRTTTTNWNAAQYFQYNLNLTTINFPVNPVNFTFARNTVTFNLRFNPVLTTLNNFNFALLSGTTLPAMQIVLRGSPLLAQTFITSGIPNTPTGIWAYIEAAQCNLTVAEMMTFIDYYWNRRTDFHLSYKSTFTLNLQSNLEAITGYLAPAGFKYNNVAGITKGVITRIQVTPIVSPISWNIEEGETFLWTSGHVVNGDWQWGNLLSGQRFMAKNKSGNFFDLYTEDGLTPIDTSVGYPATYLTNSARLTFEGTGPTFTAGEKLYVLNRILPLTVTI